jgi:ribosomal protein S13
MYVFGEVNLNLKKDIRCSLMGIYGIGFFRSHFLLSSVGLSKLLKMKNLSYFFYRVLVFLLRFTYLTDIELRQRKQSNIEIVVASQSYRGMRFLMKLPQCNQRTRTNAKTAKRRK